MNGSKPLQNSESLVELALSTGHELGADETEVSISRHSEGLTRFADSVVHQQVATDDTSVSVRVVIDGRVGAYVTNRTSSEGVRDALDAALRCARLTPPDSSWPGVAPSSHLGEEALRYDEATAMATPSDRVGVVANLLSALSRDQRGAGALSTAATYVDFATSQGARFSGQFTRASISTVVTGRSGASGWAEDGNLSLDAIDGAQVGERASTICRDADGPQPFEPGDHAVVLSGPAVMTLVDHLGLCAFSGKAWNEGRSAFSGRIGQQVVSPLISIRDDALEPGAMGLLFDGEGTPKQRVDLISDGVASAVVHDRRSAHVAGTTSTGHGLGGSNPWGPYPSHLVLAPGPSSTADLIAGVEHGLLVTRFWYTRVVNPKQSLITGMTRDGTFRISNGVVTGPVRNLRYNVSILDALSSCDGVGNELQTCCDEGGDTRVPALRLKSFNFTSVTDH